MKKTLLAITLFTTIVVLATISALVKAENAQIWTDKADYSPEETVIINGSGFLPDATITITVTRPDSSVDTWDWAADADGNFVTAYQLDGITGTYTVTATDGTNTAATTFTDSRPLQFRETGLPSGTLWSVTVTGLSPPTKSSTTDTIAFGNVAEGTSWPYSVLSPISGGTGVQYVATPSSGTASVPTGSGPVTVSITFTTQYQVSFAVSPSGKGTTIPSATAYYSDGDVIDPLEATPIAGYAFSSWSVSTTTGTITIADTSSASTKATIHGTGTITANFRLATVQITVTSSPAGSGFVKVDGVAYDTPQVFTWTPGDSHTLEAISPVSGGAGIQYVYTGWSDSGTQKHDITVPSIATTYTASYKTQYLLTVTTSGLTSASYTTPVSVGGAPTTDDYGVSTIYDGSANGWRKWFDASPSTTGTIGVDSPVAEGAGTQYVFTDWASDGSTNPHASLALISPVTLTADYKIQYYVTFTQTGLDGTSTGTVLTIGATTKTEAQLPYSDWFDSTAIYSYTATVSSSVSGKRFSLTDVTGTFGPGATISGNYHTEYHVTFTYSGLDADATSTVVTIGGNAKLRTDLPLTDWFDSTTSFTYESIVDSSVSGKRFRLDSVTGLTSPIGTSGTVTGNYVIQYQVTFTQTGLDNDASGTVVTIGGVAKTKADLPITDVWYDSGTTYSFESIVSGGSGKQFVLTGVTGPTSPIVASGTVTGAYKTQYYVTFAQSGVGTDFTGKVMTIDSVDYDRLGHSDWYDDGAKIDFSFKSPLDVNSGKRYFFVSADETSPLTVSKAQTVTGTYKTQYLLTVSTTPVNLSPQPTVTLVSGYDAGNGWYDESSVVSIDPDSPAGYTFDHWNGGASGNAVPLSVTMDSAKNIVAVFSFNLAVETGFKPGDSPSFASDPYLDEILCVLQKVTTTSYKLVGTSPGTYDYAISIKNTGTTIFNSITITVKGNADHYLKSSNPIRVLDANGNVITSQFTISGTWPTVTITSNLSFQGLRGSASLYVTIHLDYTKKGSPVSSTQFYNRAYTFKTEVSGSSGPNPGNRDTYGSVVFLSKKMTVICGFVKTSSSTPIKDATIDLYKGGTLLNTVHTDEDGFYCFINTVEDDNGNIVNLSGGTIYTLICTLSDPLVLTKQVTAQTNTAVQVLFTKP